MTIWLYYILFNIKDAVRDSKFFSPFEKSTIFHIMTPICKGSFSSGIPEMYKGLHWTCAITQNYHRIKAAWIARNYQNFQCRQLMCTASEADSFLQIDFFECLRIGCGWEGYACHGSMSVFMDQILYNTTDEYSCIRNKILLIWSNTDRPHNLPEFTSIINLTTPE